MIQNHNKNHTCIIGALFLTSLIFFSPDQVQAASNNYDKCFKRISQGFKWPLGPSMAKSEECIKAATVFGPMMSSCIRPGEYSFSRSVSYSGNVGDSVHAVFDGTVVKTGYYFPGIDEFGLQTIIIKHDFPQEMQCWYENQEVKSFFTIYSHIMTNQSNNGVVVGQTVSAGDIIGSIGYCNKCKEEILGNQNKNKASLLYQVRLDVETCPDLGRKCGKYGSPVHPHRAIPKFKNLEYRTTYKIEMSRSSDSPSSDVIFNINGPCWQNDIVGYDIRCYPEDEGVDQRLILDFETRKGFGSMPDIYQQNKTQPYVQPEMNPFVNRQNNGRWKTNVVVPWSWCPFVPSEQQIAFYVVGMYGREDFDTSDYF